MVWSKIFGITCGIAFFAGSVSAATLPTAKDVQAKMGMGFNIGNSMEVPNNPTAWGNPFPTQALRALIRCVFLALGTAPLPVESSQKHGSIL